MNERFINRLNNGFNISSTDSELNMASWVTDKSQTLVSNIASLIDKIRANDSLNDEEKMVLYDGLNDALYDATKLLSFGCGCTEIWLPAHPTMVFKEGSIGYKKLTVIYGLSDL